MAHEHEGHPRGSVTAVIEVGGLHWGSEKKVIEAVLGRRPGVVAVEANPVAQTATVTYDPARTAVVELRNCLSDCGCATVATTAKVSRCPRISATR